MQINVDVAYANKEKERARAREREGRIAIRTCTTANNDGKRSKRNYEAGSSLRDEENSLPR